MAQTQRPRNGGRSFATIYGWVTADLAKKLRTYAKKHEVSANYVMEVALRMQMLNGEPGYFPLGDGDVDLNLACDAKLRDDVTRYNEYYKINDREILNYALDSFPWESKPDFVSWRKLLSVAPALIDKPFDNKPPERKMFGRVNFQNLKFN